MAPQKVVPGTEMRLSCRRWLLRQALQNRIISLAFSPVVHLNLPFRHRKAWRKHCFVQESCKFRPFNDVPTAGSLQSGPSSPLRTAGAGPVSLHSSWMRRQTFSSWSCFSEKAPCSRTKTVMVPALFSVQIWACNFGRSYVDLIILQLYGASNTVRFSSGRDQNKSFLVGQGRASMFCH